MPHAQWSSSDTQVGVQTGSWSLYGLSQGKKKQDDQQRTEQDIFRVTYLTKTECYPQN